MCKANVTLTDEVLHLGTHSGPEHALAKSMVGLHVHNITAKDVLVKLLSSSLQLDVEENYKALSSPMVSETYKKVTHLIKSLRHGEHIDAMTEKWLSLTQNPPRITVFYTLTKIHKPNPVGRPIISGCEGPTERISSFVCRLPPSANR